MAKGRLMAKVHAVQQDTPNDPEFMFFCPGCKCGHWFKTTGEGPRWTWNGDFDRPTINPSIVAMPEGPKRCHSFVRDGQIQFLSDCWHKMKNKTVLLKDF